MENIVFENSVLRIETATIGHDLSSMGETVPSFAYTADLSKPLALETADEVPLFLAVKGKLLIAMSVSAEEAMAEEVKAKLRIPFTQFNVDKKEVEAYIGPCLTFSHTAVDRPTIEKLYDMGYRAAAKRTSGVDFMDVPVLVLMQLRSFGIPMDHIHIGNYDTFENPELLYSKLRGDKKTNRSVAKLLG